MGYQTVRALVLVKHDGVDRKPGVAEGKNAQDFVVSDDQAQKLIGSGFATALGVAEEPRKFVSMQMEAGRDTGEQPAVAGFAADALGPLDVNLRGTTGNAARLQAAINARKAKGGGQCSLPINVANRVVPMEAGIALPSYLMGIFGHGAVLDFSQVKSGWVFTRQGFVGDINYASSVTQPNKVSGLHLRGPGKPNAATGLGWVGCFHTDATDAYLSHNYQNTTDNTTVWGFGQDSHRLSRNNWGCNFFGVHWRPHLESHSVLHAPAYQVDGSPMANAGERMTFEGNTALNGGCLFKGRYGNADYHYKGGSVDQFDCVADVGAGKFVVTNAHLENLKNNDYQFKATGGNATIVLDNVDIYIPVGANYDRYAYAYSDESARFGGIEVGTMSVSLPPIQSGVTYRPQTWVEGDGRAVCRGAGMLDSAQRVPFSRWMNRLPDCSKVSALNGWVALPGQALRKTTADKITVLPGTRGRAVNAVFEGRALVAADVGSHIWANSDGSAGSELIVGVNSATEAVVDILVPFTNAVTEEYYAFFGSDAGVPTKAAGWKQPFKAGAGLMPRPGDTVSNAGGTATMQVVRVKKLSGQFKYDDAVFEGYVVGGVLTVTKLYAESMAIGRVLSGGGFAAGTTIVVGGTGTGGAGTYALSINQDIPAGAGLMYGAKAGDAAGEIYGFSKTGSFTLDEDWFVGGVKFGKVNSGGAATPDFALSFGEAAVAPARGLTLSSTAVGQNVTATADGAAFSSNDRGRTIRAAAGGTAVITAVVSATVATVSITTAFVNAASASGQWVTTIAQRFEKWLPWEPGDQFLAAWIASRAGNAAADKAFVATVAYCDENRNVITSTLTAKNNATTDGFLYGDESRANVTAPDPGTAWVRLRYEAGAARALGGTTLAADFIVNGIGC